MPKHASLHRHQAVIRIPFAPMDSALRRAGVIGGQLPPALDRAVHRGRSSGWITPRAADLLACQVLREHPALIWGPAWWDLPTA